MKNTPYISAIGTVVSGICIHYFFQISLFSLWPFLLLFFTLLFFLFLKNKLPSTFYFFHLQLFIFVLLRLSLYSIPLSESVFWVKGHFRPSLYYMIIEVSSSSRLYALGIKKILILPPYKNISTTQEYLCKVQVLSKLPKSNPVIPSWRLIKFQNNAQISGRIIRCFPLSTPNSSTTSRSFFASLNFFNKYSNQFPYPLNGLIRSLLTGDRNSLSKGLKKIFSLIGLQHILALSGLHFAIVLMLIYFFVETFRIQGKVILIILFPIILFYLHGTGWPITLIRASAMGLFFLIVKILERRTTGLHIFTFIAFFFLCIQPLFIFNLGFQFSFGAITGILIYTRTIGKRKIYSKLYSYFMDLFGITLFIQLTLLPIQIFHFGQFSIAGFFFNLIGIPLFSVLMWLLLIDFLFFQWMSLHVFFVKSISWLFFIFLKIVKLMSFLAQFFHVKISFELSIGIFLTFLVFTFIPKLKNKFIISSLIIGVLLLMNLLHSQKACIYFFDMNQANSTLLSYKNTQILIDCGKDYAAFSPYYSVVYNLEKLHIHHLDAIYITHLDQDHVGQLPYILKKIKVEKLYFPRTKDLKNRLSDIFNFLHAGNRILYAEDFIFTIISPDSIIQHFSKSENDKSLIIKATIKSNSILFTGDVSATVQNYISAQNILSPTDILVSPHHGSKYSISPSLIESIHPSMILISCGFQNIYHHPSKETLHLYKKLHIPFARTDLDGCISFSF